MNNTNNFNKIENTIMIEEQLNKELSIYSYTTSDNTCLEYFVGYEIAVILGYKNTTQVIQYISKSNQLQFRDYTGVKIPYLDPRTILISRDGAIEILLKTRKSISADVLQILQKFNIKTPTKKSITQKTQEIQEIQVNDTENNQELDFEEDDEENNELLTYSYISNHICFEYFVGYQIASLVGYKSPHSFITQNISKSNQIIFREYPGPKIPELDPRTILISRDGAIEILLKTRKRISPDVLHLLKEFHIETTNMKCLTKEQQTLSAITNVLKTENFEDQYKIGSYYLDLYFTEYKIVVECDENGHADRKPYKERERMDYVNKELDIDDSNWIRYNPDEKDFDISKMIGRIYIKINEIKFINQSKIDALNESKIVVIPINKKRIRKKKEENDMRQCICCKIDKQKTTNFTRCGVGYLSKCKECSNKILASSFKTYQCSECKDVKNISEFYLRPLSDKVKDGQKPVRSKCKSCFHKAERKFKLALKTNPLIGKKKCVGCEEYHKFDMFLKSNETDDKLSEKCKECFYLDDKNKDCKQCNKCLIVKSYNKFQKDTSKLDGYHTICADCRNLSEISRRKNLCVKVICEYCDKELSCVKSLKSHQKTTIACLQKQGLIVVEKTEKKLISKKVICEYCDKELSSAQSLKLHQKTIDCLQKQGIVVGKKLNGMSKKVIQIDIKTNKIKNTYNSITEAAKSCGLQQKGISGCCMEKQKTCGGFIWKYKE